MIDDRRRQCELLRGQLELERSTFWAHWRELGENVTPRRMRFAVSDVNRGERRNSKIVDSTPTLALRTLRAGMMGGVTSPARPWFRLATPDPGLTDKGPVKQWLDVVSQRMTAVYLRSNLYNVLPIIYGDIGLFGTSALYIEEDFEDVVRFYSFPIGTYSIACDSKGRVNVFIRDFRMTVKQLVEKFGYPDGAKEIDWSCFSSMVKNLWDQNLREGWIDVCHVIRPNDCYDAKKMASKFKKYSSIYYERGQYGSNNSTTTDPNLCLSERGYDYFPVLCPRWEVSAEDAYGTTCPGMDALGDIKQLMLCEKRIMQAIEKMVNPPMVAPTSMRNTKTSILPGDISYGDIREGTQGFRPAHEVNPRIVELEQKQEQVRGRIKKAFFEDLFLMIAESDRRQVTATEINEKKEEKLLALGPVLEQLNQDLLDPLIDITFAIMHAQSIDAFGNYIPGALIPEPPQELSGQPLKIEYISIMAQAQKLAGISGIERFMHFVGEIAQESPEAKDKINIDNVIDMYGDMTSVPAQLIRSEDEVAAIRQQQQKAQQQMQQQQAMQTAAGTAKDLSQTDTSGNNALTQLMQQSKAGQLQPT